MATFWLYPGLTELINSVLLTTYISHTRKRKKESMQTYSAVSVCQKLIKDIKLDKSNQ